MNRKAAVDILLVRASAQEGRASEPTIVQRKHDKRHFPRHLWWTTNWSFYKCFHIV